MLVIGAAEAAIIGILVIAMGLAVAGLGVLAAGEGAGVGSAWFAGLSVSSRFTLSPLSLVVDAFGTRALRSRLTAAVFVAPSPLLRGPVACARGAVKLLLSPGVFVVVLMLRPFLFLISPRRLTMLLGF